MLTVALTGGIASGKSIVAQVLAEKGCLVRSADLIARELMRPRRPAWKEMVKHFGPKILNPDLTINRARLADIIFSDSDERAYLNGLIHPRVLAERQKEIRALEKKRSAKIYVSEAALTIESGYARYFDKLVVVHCPKQIQVRRLMARDHIGKGEALKRIGAQLPLREKLRHADYAIETSGSVAETVEQTERIHAQLILDAELKARKALVSRLGRNRF